MASSSSASRSEANVPCEGYLYGPGKDLKIQFLRPFQPFGDSWYETFFDTDETYGKVEDISNMSTEDYIFTKRSRVREQAPALARTPEHAADYLGFTTEKAALRIIGGLSMSTGLGAQVLLCNVLTAPADLWKAMGFSDRDFPQRLVAKVFDPLYFPKMDSWSRHNDVVSMADKAFAHEAAAYMELHHFRKVKPIIDELVPKFYGTFSVRLADHDKSRRRNVRMVLMEYIPGETIFDMSVAESNAQGVMVLNPPADVSAELALEAFERVLRGISAMEHVGVFHQDIKPFNVIVSLQQANKGTKKTETRLRRVVMVDFDVSRVSRYTKEKEHFLQGLDKPLHPTARFFLGALHSFAGWYPAEWLTECHKREDELAADEGYVEEGEHGIDTDKRLLKWEEWACKTMAAKDFTMAREAEDLAYKHRIEREAAEAREAAKAAEAKEKRAAWAESLAAHWQAKTEDAAQAAGRTTHAQMAQFETDARPATAAELEKAIATQAPRSLKRRPESLDLTGTKGDEQNPMQPSTPTATSFSQTNTADPDVQQESPSKRQKTADLRATTASMTPVANVFGQMGFDTPTNKATQEPDSPSQADGR
ncbi:hypothetical protein B0T11DRAFT_72230 [Plectosphaerella cucumerina]|uniref:Protein kinase domain-containing protein n=1 Tax=Plectosphaerella cucumerina TaxID=40658 RepID=A0A8K0X848_9PEZI|nr:hypothetical protein B0T11DRAFT_72230 [Plectosphaerella cucumerina]